MANIAINSVIQRIQHANVGAGLVNFNIPFPFLADGDITVYNNSTLLVLTTNYTLTGAGNANGGTLTLNVATAGGEDITILGTLTVDRTSIYNNALNALTGTDLNNDFNREILMISQRYMREEVLMLQYQPYVEISQTLTTTTDRWLPLLPAKNVWRKNAGNTAIEAVELPDNPVNTGSTFTADNRLVKTDTPTSNTSIQQTDMLLTDAYDLSNSSGNWSISSGGTFGITTTGNLTVQSNAAASYNSDGNTTHTATGNWTLSSTGNTVIEGVTYPKVGAAVSGYVLGLSGPTTATWVAAPGNVLMPVADNAVARYNGTSGQLQNSSITFSDIGATVANYVDIGVTAGSGVRHLGRVFLNADPSAALEAATKQYVDALSDVSLAWNQVGHGLAVGDIVYKSTSALFTKAQADAAATAEVAGVVSAVIDANNIEVTLAGHITGLSGMTAGQMQYLSTSVAGGRQTAVPTAVGHVIKPVMVALTASTAVVVNQLGITI